MTKNMKRIIIICGFTAILSANAAILTWTDNSNNEKGFEIERALYTGSTLGNYAKIATVGENITTYTDDTPEKGKKYSYRVLAFNDSGKSDYSASADWNEPEALNIPANFALVVVKLTPVGSTHTWNATFTWTDNNTTETTYRLEYKKTTEAETEWKAAGTVAANVTTFTTVNYTDLTGSYHWRLRAVRGLEMGPPTAVLTTPPANSFKVTPPGNLQVK